MFFHIVVMYSQLHTKVSNSHKYKDIRALKYAARQLKSMLSAISGPRERRRFMRNVHINCREVFCNRILLIPTIILTVLFTKGIFTVKYSRFGRFSATFSLVIDIQLFTENMCAFRQNIPSYFQKSTIVLSKKYYRFRQKVLSFCLKSTIVLPKKYYRFA